MVTGDNLLPDPLTQSHFQWSKATFQPYDHNLYQGTDPGHTDDPCLCRDPVYKYVQLVW